MRRCECDRMEKCRLCWLWHNDARYRRHWWRGVAVIDDPPAQRRPCLHEGPIVEHCPRGNELLHVRDCAVHDRCTRGPSRIRSCSSCGDYRAPELPPIATSTPIRLDHTNLAEGIQGLRFNSSIIDHAGGYAYAFRTGWAGSEIYCVQLDAELRQAGPPVLLPFRRRDCGWGREDPRLFRHKGRLHVEIIGVVGRWGPTNVLFARLSDRFAIEDSFHPHYARRQSWEKNWGFFDVADELYAVYSIQPHRVLRIRGNRAELVHPAPFARQWNGGEMRGGACPIRVGDEFWSFFHDRVQAEDAHLIYRMGLYTFSADPPFRPLRWIPEPVVAADRATKPADQYASVVFPGGAVRRGDQWLIACGIHDRWSEVLAFDHAELEGRLLAI